MFPVDNIQNNDEDERKAFDKIEDKTEKKGEKPTGEDKQKGEKRTEEEETSEKIDDTLEEVFEEEEEEEEEEDKLKGEEEEEEEEILDDSVYQALKKQDKDIFKKVPELKQVIFREQAYTQVFPTVKEAQNAAEIVQTFSKYQDDILSGNSENILEALEKTDKNALQNFVANFIPTVEKQSKELYLNIIYPEIKKLVRVAAKSGNETLINSAKNLHWFVFGDFNLDSDVGLKPGKKSEREEELSKREREFELRQYESFHKDVISVGENRAKRFIGQAFRDSGISDLQQKHLTNEIYDRVEQSLIKDVRHVGNMNNLWLQARNAGFTSEWKDRIINAYLSRAKLLIPKFRQQVLAEAKLSGTKVKESNGEERPVKRIPSGAGTTSSQFRGKIDPRKVNWEESDERAMLDGNIILKK